MILRALALGLLCCLAGLAAADPAAGSAKAREAAEAALAAARARITAERTALVADLQQRLAAASAARDRLAAAERRRDLAQQEERRRQGEAQQALIQLRGLADRAVIAARIPDADRRRLGDQPPAVRLDAAIAELGRRVDALAGRLGRRQAEIPVITRSGGIATAPVLFLGEARAIALGEGAARGLLQPTGDGSWRVAGPAIPALAGIPLDPDGRAVAAQPRAGWSLAGWIAAGRFFMWPILAVLLAGAAIAIVRARDLRRLRTPHDRLVAIAGIADLDHAAAAAMVAPGATPLDRVLAAGLAVRDKPRPLAEAAVEQALIAETARLHRGLPAILVLAGIAPLLGLLGTVTGMIDLFGVIAAEGTGNARSLSGGISEALTTTQAGMIVAIPLLLIHAALHRAAQRREQILEEAACAVLGLGRA